MESIVQLFEKFKEIKIPVYQRAYSWEEAHYKQFLDDLIEQKGIPYYLGQFLFEKAENDEGIYYIIDGQQRLTTSVILISVITKKLKDLGSSENTEKRVNLYLSDKFQTIEDDQVFFKKCTRKHLSREEDAETTSQKRILDCYNYFSDEISKTESDLLEGIIESLEKASITTSLVDKKKATQVFEYQNNRGKDLSQFELIKAYLMHQLYINADNANSEITKIQSLISKTYRNMEATESYFTEVELLNIFCYLEWGMKGNISEVKKHLKHPKKDIVKNKWIMEFFESFEEITALAKSVSSKENIERFENLFFVGNKADWKIILISIFHKGENNHEQFPNLLKLLEVLCFKLKLGDYRTDYLPKYAKKYFNNEYKFDELLEKIKSSADAGFKGYWNNDGKFTNKINSYFDDKNHHYPSNVIKFVLWQYEKSIREKNKSDLLSGKKSYDEYTIEHIAPQKPKPSEDAYDKQFEDNFLHKAGNLALLTKSQNSKFSNKSFEYKKELFQDTALSSYTEIRENDNWGKSEIEQRHENISDFAKEYFDISSICLASNQ